MNTKTDFFADRKTVMVINRQRKKFIPTPTCVVNLLKRKTPDIMKKIKKANNEKRNCNLIYTKTLPYRSGGWGAHTNKGRGHQEQLLVADASLFTEKWKIQNNWCTVAPTIEHHGGHSRTPANQSWDQVPGRESAYPACLQRRLKRWLLYDVYSCFRRANCEISVTDWRPTDQTMIYHCSFIQFPINDLWLTILCCGNWETAVYIE